MKQREQVKRAAAWWDKTGRYLMDKRVNEIITSRFRVGGPGPAIKTTTRNRDLASGILNGLAWDELTRREQVQVVKTWAHYQGSTESPEQQDAEQAERARRLGQVQ